MPIVLQPTTFKYKNSNGTFQSASCISGQAIVRTITGATPTIVAEDNTRYMCGEVSTLNFTPCATGVCDVVFTSGSTATVLTLPTGANEIKWANGFDPDNLDANTVYELNVQDGIYGVACSWT